ncbi:hypothetical protein QQ045_002485 [Rhodiola kirilowii]
MLLPIMEKVMIVIVKAMKNPRSALCKTSIMAAADIISAYADTLLLDETLTAESFDQLLLQLLLKASRDKKFVCEEADRALKVAVAFEPIAAKKYGTNISLLLLQKKNISLWQSLHGRGDTYKDLLLNVV